ncbi:hypothetical protein OSB04_015405 [Centaurea solstitialis]|uniref:Uncharacterized protein n=1 Tax=Centaurea solstitialis TaxID=347529 RepID=A0AA38WGI3_9ASTR|nr:hypothetical protein OSB04_015405 [Centaurea solstitialis]
MSRYPRFGSRIASGRLKQGTYVWRHLTRVAAEFASPLIGSRTFTSGVGRTRMSYGVHRSKTENSDFTGRKIRM